jgi:hypothetical protein
MTLLELVKQSVKWAGIWLVVLAAAVVAAVSGSVLGVTALLGILDMIGKK